MSPDERHSAVQYRLSWETVDAHFAAVNDGVWPRLSDAQWDALPWHSSSRVADSLDDVQDQHDTLKRWAETHEEPIRKVMLEARSMTEWEPVGSRMRPCFRRGSWESTPSIPTGRLRLGGPMPETPRLGSTGSGPDPKVTKARRALDAAVYEALGAGLTPELIQDEIWAALVDATGEDVPRA